MFKFKFSFIAVSALISSCAMAQTYVAQEVTTGGLAYAISGGIVGGYQGTPAHAMLWSPTGSLDVHPAGYNYSTILGMSGTTSVGYAGTTPMVWQGTNASALNVPFAYYSARASATDGNQAVGMAYETNVENLSGPAHAMLWDLSTGAATDLGKNATVSGVGGGAQAGFKQGSKGTTAGFWRGTSNSYVSLHIKSATVSVACDTNGTQQVGYTGVDIRVRNEAKPRDIRFYSAVVWNSSVANFQYLGSEYVHSFALGIKGDTIVGYGNTSDAIGTPKFSRATAWVGPNYDYVNLHAYLPADMQTSRATGVDENGNIVGYGVTTGGVMRSYVWIRQ